MSHWGRGRSPTPSSLRLDGVGVGAVKSGGKPHALHTVRGRATLPPHVQSRLSRLSSPVGVFDSVDSFDYLDSLDTTLATKN